MPPYLYFNRCRQRNHKITITNIKTIEGSSIVLFKRCDNRNKIFKSQKETCTNIEDLKHKSSLL